MISSYFLKNLNEIKKGGIKILFHKINKLIYLTITSFFEYPFIAIVYFFIVLLSPFILIRIGFLRMHKIGSAIELELYFAEKKILENNKKTLDVFFRETKIANNYLFELQKKKIIVLPKFIFKNLFRIFIKFKKHNHLIPVTFKTFDRDINHVLYKTKQVIQIPKVDKIKGLNYLNKRKVKNISKIILLNVRDSAYYGFKPSSEFRNADINKFIPAIKFLVSKGYYIFRTGAKVSKKVNFKHKNFIDYASNGDRSEFLDIFLADICNFCITTSCGYDSVPAGFRKPLVVVNYSPIDYFVSEKKAITIFKHPYDIDTNRKLPLSDLYSLGLNQALNTQDYLIKGVTLKENSSTEIKEVIKEAHGLFGKKNYGYKTTKNQLKFQKTINSKVKTPWGSRLHNKFVGKIGENFLIKNRQFLK